MKEKVKNITEMTKHNSSFLSLTHSLTLILSLSLSSSGQSNRKEFFCHFNAFSLDDAAENKNYQFHFFEVSQEFDDCRSRSTVYFVDNIHEDSLARRA